MLLHIVLMLVLGAGLCPDALGSPRVARRGAFYGRGSFLFLLMGIGVDAMTTLLSGALPSEGPALRLAHAARRLRRAGLALMAPPLLVPRPAVYGPLKLNWQMG